jgi:hypothetical protein
MFERLKQINFNLKRALRFSALIILVGFIGVYAYQKTRLISRGVTLVVNFPTAEETIFEKSVIPIDGTAPNAKHLDINGREISINEDGEFSDNLILISGLNHITVVARDKFEKESIKEFSLFLISEESIENLKKPPEIEGGSEETSPEETLEDEDLILEV